MDTTYTTYRPSHLPLYVCVVPYEAIMSKFSTAVDLNDFMTSAEFGDNRVKGGPSGDVQNLPFPLYLIGGPYNNRQALNAAVMQRQGGCMANGTDRACSWNPSERAGTQTRYSLYVVRPIAPSTDGMLR